MPPFSLWLHVLTLWQDSNISCYIWKGQSKFYHFQSQNVASQAAVPANVSSAAQVLFQSGQQPFLTGSSQDVRQDLRYNQDQTHPIEIYSTRSSCPEAPVGMGQGDHSSEWEGTIPLSCKSTSTRPSRTPAKWGHSAPSDGFLNDTNFNLVKVVPYISLNWQVVLSVTLVILVVLQDPSGPLWLSEGGGFPGKPDPSSPLPQW